MKRALVLTLLVFGLGAAVYAGPLTGSWSTNIQFDPDPSFTVSEFESILDIDYSIGGWTFGSTAIFNLSAFDNLFFTAQGSLGAFTMRSMLDFEPQTPSFMAWTNAAKLSIAGVDLFGLFVVLNLGSADVPLIGTGATIGMSGSAGEVDITATVQFNMPDRTYHFHNYGYDWAVARDAYQSCGTYGNWTKPSSIPYGVQTASCTLGWSGAGIYVDFPFTCLDVAFYASFTCTDGFKGFGFALTGIETGISWLVLEELDIDFTVNSKTVTAYFGMSFGDFVCVTPYISLVGGDYSIEGLRLNALALSYSFNGVTFKAGEIFHNDWEIWALNYYTPQQLGYAGWGFRPNGAISYTCVYNIDYDQFFGIEIDGDSCCGGAFNVGVYSFFDTSTSTLFAWQETLASVELGIGTNTSVYFGVSLKNGGLNWFDLGVEFTW